MSDREETLRRLKELEEQTRRSAEEFRKKLADPSHRRFTVNKRTHRIRFENETEDEVTIVVEEKGGEQ